MFLLILATYLRNYYFWFSWMFFSKLSLWRRSLSRVQLSIDLRKKSKDLFKCDRNTIELCNWIRINMIFINRYWKQLRPATMLKKTSSQAFSCKFCEFLHNDGFCDLWNFSSNFWMTASRFFNIEATFCERDKNHKFDNFEIIPG